MNPRAQGFTLIELLIVTVLGAVVMGAVYQTLTVQMRSNRQVNAVVNTQQTIRAAVQILQSELREVGGRAGDVRAAAPESLTVRALRKVGFACGAGVGGSVEVHTVGDVFSNKDSLLIYATRQAGVEDDTILRAYINAEPGGPLSCTKLTGQPWDSLKADVKTLNLNVVAPGVITDINTGDPIRSFQSITYGIYLKGGRYVLGRRAGADSVVTLIGPLARPADGGFVLSYYDSKNQLIPTASLGALRDSIARVNIRIKGSTPGAADSPGGAYKDSLVADIFLRGN